MQSAALFTDLYQLTMAYGYWKNRVHEQRAAFHVAFRKPPFGGGYAVACGIAPALDYLANFRFEADDLKYLASIVGNDGKPLFESAFLDFLGEMRLELDVAAVEEGEIVFGHEPLMRVEGPILQCQLVETALLTIINFQTLIATKAARVCDAAGGDEVLEFGARRAQGFDGALSASRAAYIGGCAATSNVLAGKQFGIPVRGTHAHSWVMLFGDELQAFKAYARALPNNCSLLVDTYDTLEGVRHAVQIGHWLRPLGHRLAGIRLDSGDLAWLSKQARAILDEGGLPEVPIVASNDLDETIIESLKVQGAPINIWGVGTRLVTGEGQSALGGVYKLAAILENDVWQPRIKLSEQAIKTSVPTRQQVRRFFENDAAAGDAIFSIDAKPEAEKWTVTHPEDSTRKKILSGEFRDLLTPAMANGQRQRGAEKTAAARTRCQANIKQFHAGIRRFINPHAYPAGLESSLADLRYNLTQR
ncbi:MAG TPA: nicotinate phosphoribosyltransferase [Abditibacteriaceae bacterium]